MAAPASSMNLSCLFLLVVHGCTVLTAASVQKALVALVACRYLGLFISVIVFFSTLLPFGLGFC